MRSLLVASSRIGGRLQRCRGGSLDGILGCRAPRMRAGAAIGDRSAAHRDRRSCRLAAGRPGARSRAASRRSEVGVRKLAVSARGVNVAPERGRHSARRPRVPADCAAIRPGQHGRRDAASPAGRDAGTAGGELTSTVADPRQLGGAECQWLTVVLAEPGCVIRHLPVVACEGLGRPGPPGHHHHRAVRLRQAGPDDRTDHGRRA